MRTRHAGASARSGRRSTGPAVLLLVVLAMACTSTSQKEEAAEEPEAPKELPGKVVERTPPAGAEGEAQGGGEAPADEADAEVYRFVTTYDTSDDPKIRSEIAKLKEANTAKPVLDALVRHRDAAVPALRLALRHKEQNVRIQAAQVLSRLSEPGEETTAAFVAALRKDPNQEVRAAVGRALTQYEDPALVAPLLEALAEDDYEIARANAAWALGAQGALEATDGLVAALEDEETWVRLRSLSAIKRLGAKKALPAVVERVKDDNPVVRERAVQTLQKLTGKRYGEDYKRWKRVVK